MRLLRNWRAAIRRPTVILIMCACVGTFFLTPLVPIMVPCYKGGYNGITGYRFEGLESYSYAYFGVGVSTGPVVDCYLP